MGATEVKFTEDLLKQLAAPLSKTEDEKCQHAIGMVRDALKQLGLLDNGSQIKRLYDDTYSYSFEMRNAVSNRKVKIFIQGSYANNTNVRTESDVDIAIVQEEVFQTEYRDGVTDADYQFTTVPSPSKTFKDEVQECLKYKFGSDVERKNKSIKIHGNTYRKDTDTVPCIRLRNYRNDYLKNADNFIGGIVIKADSGERIINYPEQHIENGRKKNNDTNRVYKRMVRIAKTIRNLMDSANFSSAKNISSFGLESLLWNIPNDIYTKYSLLGFTFEEVLQYANAHKNSFSAYKEANGIKQLCPTTADITKYQVFIADLANVFDYDYSS
jgi:hypothetical protein